MGRNLYQEYLAGSKCEEPSRLASDYLFGFDISDDFEHWYLGHAITSGCVPQEEMELFTRKSLFRGFEEWHQMLCCANAMREKASFNDPLDGQDLLTFISKIFATPFNSPSKNIHESLSHSIHQKGENNPQKPQSPPSSQTTGHTNKKRKADELSGKIDLGNRPKSIKCSHSPLGYRDLKDTIPKTPDLQLTQPGKDQKSPFWSAQSTNSSASQPSTQSEEDKKRLKREKKKAQKKESKRRKRREARARKSARHKKPVLREISNSSHQKLNSPSSEFMRGSGVLRANPPPQFYTGIEAGESSKTPQSPSTTPNNMEEMSETANLFGDASDKPKKEPDGELSPKDNSICAPSQAQCLTPKRKAKSPYFNTPEPSSPLKAKSPRPPRGTVPCIPFPPLEAPKFGLIQEDLAADPFRLLIAVTFLIRVKGKHAIPVFYKLMKIYPTPKDLAEADKDSILDVIKHLGLGTVRAAAIRKYARLWTENPPQADVRYGVKNYPDLGDGADIRTGEALHPDDPRTSAWEIGHMTQGRYAIDSWRIFCRDVLLGRAEDWRGKGREGEFQPEWMRVLPQDKELRACLRWLWMQEGWAWDPRTGEKELLPDDLRRAVNEGRVAWDDAGDLKILHKEAIENDGA
ncbi:DNA glycosylase [Hypomontagnella monticulosa]|nr:DNA glycosylase [Hypomontagnella monticulosa]